MELILQKEFLKLMKIVDGELCVMIVLMMLQLQLCVGSYDLVNQFSIVEILTLQTWKYIMLIIIIVRIAVSLVKDFHTAFIITLPLGAAMKHI